MEIAPGEGLEKIYAEREIEPYLLKPATKYLRYDRNALQQVAPDAMYRAPEKLVNNFISDKHVFAYDASGSLFLNSANILGPAIPSMSAKAVMTFLDFTLFQFVYAKLFGKVKTLKENLIELPSRSLRARRTRSSRSSSTQRGATETRANRLSLYGFSKERIAHIKKRRKDPLAHSEEGARRDHGVKSASTPA